MGPLRHIALCLSLLLAAAQARAQAVSVTPSNSTKDIFPYVASPRFILNRPASFNKGDNHTDVLANVPLAPLGPYAEGYTRGQFLDFTPTPGELLLLTTQNTDSIQQSDFVLLSCDNAVFSSGNLGPSDVFNIIYQNPNLVWLIVYSQQADHCNVSSIENLPEIGAIFTVVGADNADRMVKFAQTINSTSNEVQIIPDQHSFTNSTNGGSVTGTGLIGPSPTTAVAMIILYAITGLITGLFVIIIVTGAIRAHRHPERYGPRVLAGGRRRQGRAKGIARAMLETLPVVKFGGLDDKNAATKNDVELNNTSSSTEQSRDHVLASMPENTTTNTEGDAVAAPAANADGTDAEGHLGCSICTEDFTKGEEVRVLPCNHKFHPECVDPWLLNVSGTCPLCRVDLRPKEEATEGEPATEGEATDRQDSPSSAPLPPPLDTSGTGRRETLASLRGLSGGTREERIAALRRYRDERRRRGTTATTASQAEGAAERRRIRDRLRDRFHILTTALTTEVPLQPVGGNDTMRRLEAEERQRERRV